MFHVPQRIASEGFQGILRHRFTAVSESGQSDRLGSPVDDTPSAGFFFTPRWLACGASYHLLSVIEQACSLARGNVLEANIPGQGVGNGAARVGLRPKPIRNRTYRDSTKAQAGEKSKTLGSTRDRGCKNESGTLDENQGKASAFTTGTVSKQTDLGLRRICNNCNTRESYWSATWCEDCLWNLIKDDQNT